MREYSFDGRCVISNAEIKHSSRGINTVGSIEDSSSFENSIEAYSEYDDLGDLRQTFLDGFANPLGSLSTWLTAIDTGKDFSKNCQGDSSGEQYYATIRNEEVGENAKFEPGKMSLNNIEKPLPNFTSCLACSISMDALFNRQDDILKEDSVSDQVSINEEHDSLLENKEFWASIKKQAVSKEEPECEVDRTIFNWARNNVELSLSGDHRVDVIIDEINPRAPISAVSMILEENNQIDDTREEETNRLSSNAEFYVRQTVNEDNQSTNEYDIFDPNSNSTLPESVLTAEKLNGDVQSAKQTFPSTKTLPKQKKMFLVNKKRKKEGRRKMKLFRT